MKATICEEPFRLASEQRPVPHAGPGEGQVIACIVDRSLPTAHLHAHSFELKNPENDMPSLLAVQGSVMKAVGRF